MPIQQDRYESIASEVLAIYDEAESVMMHRVARRLLKGINQPGWTERKYGEVQQVTKEMRDYMRGVSEKRRDVQQEGLTQAYNGGRDAFIDEARKFTNVTGIAGLTANTSKVVRIMAELDQSMNAADRQILRTVNDAYSAIVGRTSALVATGTITYRDAVKRELDSFANRGITSFRDKADRVWDMETYAEMATLTAIERATREGYTDTMQEYGFDLAIISDHYGACPVCEAWQGVVVSVSGNTPGYHSLADAEAAGVFHPRCLHDISTYFDGITKGGRTEPREVQPPNPGYAVRSTQRMYERQVRKWKRRMAVASTPQEEREAYARVRMYQGKIRELVSDYNTDTPSSVDHLPRKYWREGGRVKMSAAASQIKSSPNSAKAPERVTAYSVIGLKSPKRPHKRDFDSEEEFHEALSKYRAEKENYDRKFSDIIEKALREQRFQTKEEFESWARSNDIILSNDFIDKIDLRTMTETSRTFEEMFERFPEIMSYEVYDTDGTKIKQTFGLMANAEGFLEWRGGIAFNPIGFGNFEEALREVLNAQIDGHLVMGDGTFSTAIRHEFGHGVDGYIRLYIIGKGGIANLDDWRGHFSSFAEYRNACQECNEVMKKYDDELRSLAGLSGSSDYSNTNLGELFAEGFAEWSSGGQSEFAVKFGEFFKRWYK